MTYEEALNKAKEMVTAANEIVVVTHGKPTMDSMGGSLALMLGLISLGKKATVVCPDAVTVEHSSFVGVDKVVRDFGKKNFVISFDYQDGSIEKVSYNIENKRFNLVVEHRPGYEPLSSDKVQYDYQGVSADLIISVDTQDFNQLGSIYEPNKALLTSKPVINVDCHDANINYGAINLVDPGASSTAELVAELMATLGVKLTTDIAVNLLNAVYAATNNFTNPNVTSMAFEVASVCLKAGATRFGVEPPKQTQAVQQSSQVTQSAPVQTTQAPVVEIPQGIPRPVQETAMPQVAPAVSAPVAEPKIYVNNKPVSPGQVVEEPKRPESKKQEETSSVQPGQVPQQPAGKPVTPPSDWLKPKIFKSSGSLS